MTPICLTFQSPDEESLHALVWRRSARLVSLPGDTISPATRRCTPMPDLGAHRCDRGRLSSCPGTACRFWRPVSRPRPCRSSRYDACRPGDPDRPLRPAGARHRSMPARYRCAGTIPVANAPQRSGTELPASPVSVSSDGEGISQARLPAACGVLDRRVAECRARIAWFEQAADGNILPRARALVGRARAPAR